MVPLVRRHAQRAGIGNRADRDGRRRRRGRRRIRVIVRRRRVRVRHTVVVFVVGVAARGSAGCAVGAFDEFIRQIRRRVRTVRGTIAHF